MRVFYKSGVNRKSRNNFSCIYEWQMVFLLTDKAAIELLARILGGVDHQRLRAKFIGDESANSRGTDYKSKKFYKNKRCIRSATAKLQKLTHLACNLVSAL